MNWIGLAGIALWALIPAFMADRKGHNFWVYYFLSFLLSPLISFLIVLCLRKRTAFDVQLEKKQEHLYYSGIHYDYDEDDEFDDEDLPEEKIDKKENENLDK